LLLKIISSGKEEDIRAAEGFKMKDYPLKKTPRKKLMRFTFTAEAYAAGLDSSMTLPKSDPGQEDGIENFVRDQWPILVKNT